MLIHIEEIRVRTGGKLSAGGGIAFVDAALEWIKKYGNSILQENDEMKENETTPVVWTGKVIHLMEFIYGSDTLKNFNDGKVTIKEVAAHFGKMLGIEIKDPSGCYVSMRERVQESRTTYIDSMRDALLERMDKDDEKLYRRKK
ncbi:MAG: RteC domain-containing protein [Bacteroides uniformis]